MNDTLLMKDFLIQNFHFAANSIEVMTDDLSQSHANYPSRKNILDKIGWLRRDLDEKSSIFFYFSGHGAQAKTSQKDELDNVDETILPADWETEVWISDNELNRYLVQEIPKGARMNVLFDCCHSYGFLFF